MTVGFERLNVRKQPPNKLITFITALDGPDKAIAQDFLERIAAIVYPIMKDNGLTVTSLDEFPSNKEFWGRNFNAGECIQIVLKNPHTGLWLPFQFVQGVMIHELAHIKQMNHSRAFWSVNKKFSAQLGVLRSKDYTGEGFWSAGRVLISSEYTQDRPLAESDMPESLCGGTYRTRTRTRKNKSNSNQNPKKPKLTYAEFQQRKKERKFGTSEGNKVGGDEDARVKLEKGAKSKSVPKVAKSIRGRELRAAAALKRFESQVKDEPKEEDDSTDYSEVDDDNTISVGGGNFLVSVSKKEDGRDEEEEMKKELLELAGACGTARDGSDIRSDEKDGKRVLGDDQQQKPNPEKLEAIIIKDEDDTSDEGTFNLNPHNLTTPKIFGYQSRRPIASKQIKAAPNTNTPSTIIELQTPSETTTTTTTTTTINQIAKRLPCSCCSATNDTDAILCMICANVLEPDKMPYSWKCLSTPCEGSSYVNAGDAGICGVCGQRKSR